MSQQSPLMEPRELERLAHTSHTCSRLTAEPIGTACVRHNKPMNQISSTPFTRLLRDELVDTHSMTGKSYPSHPRTSHIHPWRRSRRTCRAHSLVKEDSKSGEDTERVSQAGVRRGVAVSMLSRYRMHVRRLTRVASCCKDTKGKRADEECISHRAAESV